MATVVPPPSKRQRTDAANRAREQQDIEEIPADAGTLRLQFFDETTGLQIGQGPVLVPVVDASPKNLELLLNTLQGHVYSLTAVSDNMLTITVGFTRIHSLSIHPPSFR
jgi:ribosome assembly protein 4